MNYRYEDWTGAVQEFATFAALVAFAEARYSAREGRPIEFEGLDALQRDAAHADTLTLHEERR